MLFRSLTSFNKNFRWLNIGAFHTSIVLNDSIEIFYGFTNDHLTGIITKNQNLIENDSLYKIYSFGKIEKNFNDCMKILKKFQNSQKWLGENYLTLFNNCNSFTYKFLKKICNKKEFENFPFWIFRGEKILKFIFKFSLSYILIPFTSKNYYYNPLNDNLEENDKSLLLYL